MGTDVMPNSARRSRKPVRRSRFVDTDGMPPRKPSSLLPDSSSTSAAKRPPPMLSVDTECPLPVCAYRSEEHTSELQSLMRISYAVFCLKKKKHALLPHAQRTTAD